MPQSFLPSFKSFWFNDAKSDDGWLELHRAICICEMYTSPGSDEKTSPIQCRSYND